MPRAILRRPLETDTSAALPKERRTVCPRLGCDRGRVHVLVHVSSLCLRKARTRAGSTRQDRPERNTTTDACSWPTTRNQQWEPPWSKASHFVSRVRPRGVTTEKAFRLHELSNLTPGTVGWNLRDNLFSGKQHQSSPNEETSKIPHSSWALLYCSGFGGPSARGHGRRQPRY